MTSRAPCFVCGSTARRLRDCPDIDSYDTSNPPRIFAPLLPVPQPHFRTHTISQSPIPRIPKFDQLHQWPSPMDLARSLQRYGQDLQTWTSNFQNNTINFLQLLVRADAATEFAYDDTSGFRLISDIKARRVIMLRLRMPTTIFLEVLVLRDLSTAA
jgi:hypothetical protein